MLGPPLQQLTTYANSQDCHGHHHSVVAEQKYVSHNLGRYKSKNRVCRFDASMPRGRADPWGWALRAELLPGFPLASANSWLLLALSGLQTFHFNLSLSLLILPRSFTRPSLCKDTSHSGLRPLTLHCDPILAIFMMNQFPNKVTFWCDGY